MAWCELTGAQVHALSKYALELGVAMLESGQQQFTREQLLEMLPGGGRRTLFRALRQFRETGWLELQFDRNSGEYRLWPVSAGGLARAVRGKVKDAYPQFGEWEYEWLRARYTRPPEEFDSRLREALLTAANLEKDWQWLLKWIKTRINTEEIKFTGSKSRRRPRRGASPGALWDEDGFRRRK